MSFDLTRFDELGAAIEDAKSERDQVQGRLDADLDRLKSEFKLSDEKEGKKEAQRLEKKIKTIGKELEDKWSNLVEQYGW